MKNTDRNWVTELRSDDFEVRNLASGDLREILLRGLLGSFRPKGIDETFCEDIAQEATIKVIDRMDQFRGESRFTTWAMTIAIRLAVNQIRRKSFRQVSLEGLSGQDSLQFQVPGDSAQPDSQLGRKQVMMKLQELIEGLSDRQRVATQALLDGMPVDIIAEKTGSNRNAIYKLVHDARSKLKEGFDRSGYQWDDITAAIEGGR